LNSNEHKREKGKMVRVSHFMRKKKSKSDWISGIWKSKLEYPWIVVLLKKEMKM